MQKETFGTEGIVAAGDRELSFGESVVRLKENKFNLPIVYRIKVFIAKVIDSIYNKFK